MPETRAEQAEHDHDEEGYTGAATLTLSGEEVPVRVRILVQHEPHDGRLHWFGRVDRAERLTDLLGGRGGEVEFRTEHGSAAATIGDVDLWGRYRLSGTGRPPFPLDEPPTPEDD
ncbi:DUF4873 domain-containing protein [Pseudonocardia sp.]|jgi:hypothetical protein|uniref:DUF4873 domain-containing protein n=1 Tax=Pseudonocardia sp. TaxID=60912 RepID=UPI0031FC997C